MGERRTNFEAAAKAASRARDFAEHELAATLARDFRSDPATFDPKRLMALGSDGLGELLACLDLAEPEPKGRGDEPPNPEKSAVIRKADWSAMRRPERPMWLVGVAWGLAAGTVVLAIGLLARLIYS
ncbi:MAG: hypothetical protein K2Z25_25820 [Beijerinckiaceae bacterium]|nr:hypothetical protein [Beijerinckiaceae bacterium]